MGSVTEPWHNQLIRELESAGFKTETSLHENFNLLFLHEGKIVLNLMDIGSDRLPEELVNIQNIFKRKEIQLIHLWEDVFLSRKDQVLSRLKSLIGQNIKIHGRKTEVIRLSQKDADEFLNVNHLQFSVGAKYRYGLTVGGKIVAVACFSGLRKMHNGIADYKSAELIRFANLLGTTVIGGFTKLLSHYIKLHKPNDVMSYADRDWSIGLAYERAGFTLIEATSPAAIIVEKNTLVRTFTHRLAEILKDDEYMEVFNTGNLKYILYCE